MFRPNPEVYQELPQDSPKAKNKKKDHSKFSSMVRKFIRNSEYIKYVGKNTIVVVLESLLLFDLAINVSMV